MANRYEECLIVWLMSDARFVNDDGTRDTARICAEIHAYVPLLGEGGASIARTMRELEALHPDHLEEMRMTGMRILHMLHACEAEEEERRRSSEGEEVPVASTQSPPGESMTFYDSLYGFHVDLTYLLAYRQH